LGVGGRFLLEEDAEEEEEETRRLSVGDWAERISAPSYSDGSS
jgi:hypothetical protein